VTGPEALSVADIARRLSILAGRPLRYEDEAGNVTRERLSRLEPLAWRVDYPLVGSKQLRRANCSARAIRSFVSPERRR